MNVTETEEGGVAVNSTGISDTVKSTGEEEVSGESTPSSARNKRGRRKRKFRNRAANKKQKVIEDISMNSATKRTPEETINCNLLHEGLTSSVTSSSIRKKRGIRKREFKNRAAKNKQKVSEDASMNSSIKRTPEETINCNPLYEGLTSRISSSSNKSGKEEEVSEESTSSISKERGLRKREFKNRAAKNKQKVSDDDSMNSNIKRTPEETIDCNPLHEGLTSRITSPNYKYVKEEEVPEESTSSSDSSGKENESLPPSGSSGKKGKSLPYLMKPPPVTLEKEEEPLPHFMIPPSDGESGFPSFSSDDEDCPVEIVEERRSPFVYVPQENSLNEEDMYNLRLSYMRSFRDFLYKMRDARIPGASTSTAQDILNISSDPRIYKAECDNKCNELLEQLFATSELLGPLCTS